MTPPNIPPYLKAVFSSRDIASTVDRLGASISDWLTSLNLERDCIAVPVLRGGIFFYSDLVRSISLPVELVSVKTHAYRAGVTGEQLECVSIEDSELFPEGRAVLLVDEICDSGRTLAALSKRLYERGALAVKSAVIVRRQLASREYEPDWSGFDFPGDDWLVGYGMQEAGRWRNLPGIYRIDQDAKKTG